MSTQQVIRCPKCGLTDYRNVWSIIQESTRTSEVPHTVPLVWQGKTYYLQTKEQVTTVSALAGRLYPPKSLLKESVGKMTIRKVIGEFFMVVLGTIIGLIYTLWLIAHGFPEDPVGKIVVVIASSLLPMSILSLFFVIPNFSKEKREKHNQKIEYLERQRRKAWERYLRLCYCFKCDVVFDPEDISGKWARPEAMSEYLLFD
jgi:hypothetical protein